MVHANGRSWHCKPRIVFVFRIGRPYQAVIGISVFFHSTLYIHTSVYETRPLILVATRHRPSSTRHRPFPTRHRPSSTRHRPFPTRHWPSSTRHRPFPTRHRPSNIVRGYLSPIFWEVF